MIHPIVKYGDPVLETPTKPVEKFDEELQTLVADMFESMYAAQGVGLAAPQIGIGLRVAVIDVQQRKKSRSENRLRESAKSFTPKASSAKRKAAFRFPASADTWRARSTSRCARTTHPARNLKCAAKDCSPAPSATKSIISTAFFSSLISACSSAT